MDDRFRSRWRDHVAALQATIALRIDCETPPVVDHRARLLFIDTLGCALAGRRAIEVAEYERLVGALEPGAFAFPHGGRLALRPMMQVLAIAPTWHEACEGHPHAHGRPGLATIAALLPLALARNASVEAFIGALVIGYEIGARAGGWLRILPGLHVDGNWPGLGVAAGVARLLGLTTAQAMTAINGVACQLPNSLYLPIRTGSSIRNVYLAHSATLGLDSALAVQAGFSAPADALGYYAEHHCRASTDMPSPQAQLLLDGYLKPFAAVRHVHYGALAAKRLRERLGDDCALGNGLVDTSHIDRIVLSIYEEATVYCNNPRPATPLAAQFSLSFGIAAMLRHGDVDAACYVRPAFEDPELRRLEALVEVQVDAALTRAGRRGASLSVGQTRATGSFVEGAGGDGAPIDFVETVLDDDPALDLDFGGVVGKFVRNAAPDIGEAQARFFCNAVLGAGREVGMPHLWARLGAE